MTPEQIFDSKADCYADRFDKDERLTPAMTKKVFVDIMSRSFADVVREKLLPLEWEGPDAGEYFIKTHLGYYVIADINYNGKGRCEKFLMSAPGCRIIEYNTLDEAQTAAQQHYTDKVLELFNARNQ